MTGAGENLDSGEPITLIIADCRIPTAGLIRPLLLQPLHLLRTQLEIVDVGIFLDPMWRQALRQRHEPLLQTPAQQHLSPRLAMLGSDLLQRWVLGPLPSYERTVRLEDDVAGTAPVHDIVAREPRMEFPLAHGYGAACTGTVLGFKRFDVGFQFGKMVGPVVGHTERPDLPGSLG